MSLLITLTNFFILFISVTFLWALSANSLSPDRLYGLFRSHSFMLSTSRHSWSTKIVKTSPTSFSTALPGFIPLPGARSFVSPSVSDTSPPLDKVLILSFSFLPGLLVTNAIACTVTPEPTLSAECFYHLTLHNVCFIAARTQDSADADILSCE